MTLPIPIDISSAACGLSTMNSTSMPFMSTYSRLLADETVVSLYLEGNKDSLKDKAYFINTTANSTNLETGIDSSSKYL